MKRPLYFECGIALAMMLWISAASAGDTIGAPSPTTQPASSSLVSLSLEDLMNVTVNSVTKTDENISQAAAAVTVINQDQIHRSGLTSIPELLRLVPGLEVARINANVWAISARGFNSQFADKLLVLMDGRTIYDPLASGVFWDEQDAVLADLDKIEVIRGPGATLWGSNAVNGVINITTKSARDTQGLLTDGLFGTDEYQSSLRYGGQIGSDTYYRVYGQFRDYRDLLSGSDDHNNDGWLASHGGFRIDKYPDAQNNFTMEGDFHYDMLTNGSLPPAGHVSVNGSGQDLLGRWTHTDSPDQGLSLQLYYDGVGDRGAKLGYRRDTVDLDFQDHLPIGSMQEFTWGLGMRDERGATEGDKPVFLIHGALNKYIASGFGQDDITLMPQRLHVILGSKFEYSNYDRFQVQPSARILFTPNDHNTIWGAISRAVRSPSMFDLDENNPFGALGPDGTVSLGNRALKPEIELSDEVGYRARVNDSLTFDVAGFYSHYDQLTANTLLADNNTIIINGANGHSYGVEAAAELKVTPTWRMESSYTMLFSHARVDHGAVLDDNNNVAANPHHQIQFHNYWDLTDNIQLNASAYYVSESAGVDPYTRLDVGLNWRPNANLEIGIAGQNLLEHRHLEFSPDGSGEPVSRGAYVHLSYTR